MVAPLKDFFNKREFQEKQAWDDIRRRRITLNPFDEEEDEWEEQGSNYR